MSISIYQLGKMLDAQYALNCAYSGDESWISQDFTLRFNAAADQEWAEFLQEVTEKWKWYDSKPVFNRQEALFELVDVVHFMLAGWLSLQYLPDYQKTLPKFEIMKFTPTLEFGSEEFYGDMSRTYAQFWFSVRVDQTHIGHCLRAFIHYGIQFLGYTPDEFFEAYMLKNQRNHERVKRGVMKGVDVKKDEVPLTLEG